MNDKTILITGGTGSLGSKLVEKLIAEHNPKKVIVFSRGEEKQVELRRRLYDPDKKVRYFIGDIRDKERLCMAFRGVDIVVHCAALKHVDMCLYNPSETIKTNVYGTGNIIGAAIEQRVKKVLAISTDKAENPQTLYGAAKQCSDFWFTASNIYSNQHNTRFAVARFGNFWNSSGSVVQFFRNLKAKGAKTLPVTHPDMTRFFITLEDATNYVIEKVRVMRGGEIFTPRMKAMRIVDLAKQIHPEAEIEIIGERPVEKLHEVINVSGLKIRSDTNCVRNFSTKLKRRKLWRQ